MPVPKHRHRNQGSALLLAMLVVAMVATLAAASYWRQWQDWETERAERQRAEASWILTGAVDWARFILRADARASGNDHLGEPWSVPLQEARLSDFLAAERGQTEGMLVEAFLSGEINDQQGRINLRNLIATGNTGGSAQRAELSAADVQVVQRLFNLLGLPGEELATLLERLPPAMSVRSQAGTAASENAGAGILLRPTRLDQLGAHGLSAATLQALAPHATWLPERSTLNLNTASAIALQASLGGLEPAQAQALITGRQQRPFTSLDDARTALGSAGAAGNLIVQQHHGVASRYFTVRGRLRLDDKLFEEQALLVRNSAGARIVWRINAPPDLQGLHLPGSPSTTR